MIMKEHIKNKNDLSCAYDLLKDDGNSGVTKKYLNINGNIAQIFGDGHIEKLELTDVEYVLNNQSSYAAKKRDGTVIAWGEPESGRDTGAKQSQFTDIEQIVGSKSAFAAKKRDGTVITWGDAAFVGDPGEKQSQLTDVEYIVGGYGAFAAKKSDGTVVAWGHLSWGGDTWRKQAHLTDVEYIASGVYEFSVKKRDGSVVTWGSSSCKRKEQSELKNIVAIGGGRNHFAAMNSDGEMISWGNGNSSAGKRHAIEDCKKKNSNFYLWRESIIHSKSYQSAWKAVSEFFSEEEQWTKEQFYEEAASILQRFREEFWPRWIK